MHTYIKNEETKQLSVSNTIMMRYQSGRYICTSEAVCNKLCPTKDKGEKADEIKLSDKEKEIIEASWKIFMEKGNENGMEVFLM